MDVERKDGAPDVQARIEALKQRGKSGQSYPYPVSDAFAAVISKALRQERTARWFDAKSMLEALQASLVPVSSHFFHVFISYRVASERKLARMLYNALAAERIGADGVHMKVYLDQVSAVHPKPSSPSPSSLTSSNTCNS
jgi:hypothetical protein